MAVCKFDKPEISVEISSDESDAWLSCCAVDNNGECSASIASAAAVSTAVLLDIVADAVDAITVVGAAIGAAGAILVVAAAGIRCSLRDNLGVKYDDGGVNNNGICDG